MQSTEGLQRSTCPDPAVIPTRMLNTRRKCRFIPFCKTTVTAEALLQWSNDPLREALSILAKHDTQSVVKLDASIRQIVNGDSEQADSQLYPLINDILLQGIFKDGGRLRDEIYLQTIRQLNGNPRIDATIRAWRLMVCITGAFPPSKIMWLPVCRLLRVYCKSGRWTEDSCDKETIATAATRIDGLEQSCQNSLTVFRISGPRGYETTLEDVQYWFNEAGHHPDMFGVELADIYAHEELLTDDPERALPWIVPLLIQMIEQLGGFCREGVFRVSGDLQQKFRLKSRVMMLACSKPEISATSISVLAAGISDAAVPCSLLKLWMRVLRSPLIPDELYGEFLASSEDLGAMHALYTQKLPPPNRAVISRIVELLLELARPEHQAATKMDLSNFAMIFAPCFMRCPLAIGPQELLNQSCKERNAVMALFELSAQLAAVDSDGTRGAGVILTTPK